MADTKLKIILEALKQGSGAEEQAEAIRLVEEAATSTEKVIDELTEAEAKLGDGQEELREQTQVKIKEGREYLELLEAKAEAIQVLIEQEEEQAEKTEEVAEATNQAKVAAEGLGNAQEGQSNDTRKAEKNLEALNADLAEARKRYHAAEIGTKEFAEAQRRVTQLEQQRTEVMRTGTRTTRHGGLAMLEFSRLVEDAQYGLRGIQNNIPVLLTMLGTGAGLAGVISLVVVGLGLLLPLLKQEADYNELIADSSKRVADAKADEAKKDRAAVTAKKESQLQMDAFLEREKRRLKQQVEAIDELAAARRRERDAQQAIDDADLAIDLERIDADNSLSTGQKVAESAKAREAARQRQFERETAQREDDLATHQKKIDAAKEEIKQAELSLEQAVRLRATAGELEDANIDLKKEIDRMKARIPLEFIPALEKRVSLDAKTRFLDFKKQPTRDKFESDEQFEAALREHTSKQVYVYELTIKQLETLDRFREAIIEKEKELKANAAAIEANTGNADRLTSEANSSRNRASDDIASSQKAQSRLQSEGTTAGVLNEKNSLLQQLQTTRAQAEAEQQDALREVEELKAGIPEAFKQMGRTAEEAKAAQERAAGFTEILTAAFADNEFSKEEAQQFKAAVDAFKSDFKITFGVTLQSIGEILNEVHSVKMQLGSVQRAVKALQRIRQPG